MADVDARTTAALSIASYADASSARWGGDVLFAVDARRPKDPAVLAWTERALEPAVIARFEFASAARCDLFPSPDGRWVAVTARFDDLMPELALLFVLARDVAAPVSPTASIARMAFDGSPDRVGWCTDGALFFRSRTGHVERAEGQGAWIVYDPRSDEWLDIVVDDGAPPVKASRDPDRAALAAAHAGPVDRAMATLGRVTDAAVLEECRRIVAERTAAGIFAECYGLEEEQIAACTRAADLAPRWEAPRRRLCDVLRERADWAALRDAADGWVRAQPDNAEAHVQSAIARAQLGEPEAACGFLRRAIELDDEARYDIEDERALDPLIGREDFARLLAG